MQESQQDIIRLREQLAAKERQASGDSGGSATADDAAREAEKLREQIAQAEKAQKAREAELEAERQRRLEQARLEAAKRLAEATPAPEPAEAGDTKAVADASTDGASRDGEPGSATESQQAAGTETSKVAWRKGLSSPRDSGTPLQSGLPPRSCRTIHPKHAGHGAVVW